MKLCIYGQENIKTIEKWAEKFNEIKNQNIPKSLYTEFPYNENNLGKLVYYYPTKNEH